MIHVTCASCSKQYKLPDNTAGRKARCKACGEAMIVPEAPDDLFDDGTPASDDLTALYNSRGHGSEVIDQSDAGEAPLAFDPEAVFQHQPKAVKWEPSFKLIYGSAAAGVSLLVIGAIALLIILTTDGKEDDGPDGLDFDTTVSVPSTGTGAPSTDAAPDTDPDDTEDPATDPDPDDLEPPSTGTDPTDDVDTTEPTPPDTDDPAVDPDTETDTDPETEGPTEEPGPEVLPAGVLLAPTSSAYAIALPGELEVISQTRVAIRTAPHDDGTWLSMEVHKLSGLDRRAVTPVAEDGSTVLIRGRRAAMPAGVEVSEITSDRYTLTRLLYPKQAGEVLRRVEYVVKDGPYLISVLGRYPADDEARLALLDETAKSVQPAEDQ